MPTPPERRIVLLIDDSQQYSVDLERAITRAQPGTALRWINNGRDAIEHLLACGTSQPMPDLVLLDQVMPGGPDGFDVLRAMQSCQGLNGLDVIMVSGSDDDEHVQLALGLGAVAYICKPVERQQLAAFAAKLVTWPPRVPPQESLRSSGGNVPGSALATVDGRLQSGAMNAAHPTIDVMPPASESGLLRAIDYFRDLIGKTFDPVDSAICEACRRHHIPVAHARGRGQDQVTVANRNAVVFELMDSEFSDRVILENFQLSQRAVERLRAEWRMRKGGGSLADR